MLGHNTLMGEYTDKAAGRAKQAAGALSGDDELKRDGEAQEAKGDVKEKVNDAADAIKRGVDQVRDKVSRT